MKKILALAVAASLSFSGAALADTASTFSPAQQQEIQKITEQWLTEHPEILIKMSQELQQRQQKAQQTQLSDGVIKLSAQLQQVKGIPHAGPFLPGSTRSATPPHSPESASITRQALTPT